MTPLFLLLVFFCGPVMAAPNPFPVDAPTAPVMPGMPTVGFASSYQAASEFRGTVWVRVVLSQPISLDVTVNYTADGSAQNGVDYSLADSILIIPAGQGSATIPLTVNEDPTIEGDETIRIILSNPQNAVLGQNVFTYVIKNDDRDTDTLPAPPQLNMIPATDNRSVTLRLSGPYPNDIASVDYQIILTQTGSQMRYTIGTGTATFQRGQTQTTVQIPQPSDDITVPGVKTLTVYLNNPVNVALGNPMLSFSIQ